MRARWRSLLVAAGVLAAITAMAPGAMAKGGELVGGSATVTGPGLASPVVLRGAALERMLVWIGPVAPPLLEPRCCSHFQSPRPSTLGPRYEVRYELRFRPIDRHGPVTAVSFRQDLYPYAPNAILHQPVPWAFTPAGQRLSVRGKTVEVQSSWIDSSLLFDLLVAHGMPQTAPPAVLEETAARPGGGPVTAMGLAALGVVLLAGALGARRTIRRKVR